MKRRIFIARMALGCAAISIAVCSALGVREQAMLPMAMIAGILGGAFFSRYEVAQ